MTAGKLASSKPAATTNTILYRCPITGSASAVLNVCNQSSSATSYRVALKDYDQILTVPAAQNFYRGNPVSSYKLALSPGVKLSEFSPGANITSADGKKTAKLLDAVIPTSNISIGVKVASLGDINISSPSGTFAVGDSVSNTFGLSATVYATSTNGLTLNISPVTSGVTSIIVNDASTVIATDYLYAESELITVTGITNRTLNVTRGSLATTAAAHTAGTTASILSASASPITTTINQVGGITASDTTIPVASTSGFSQGDYIKIGNELLTITAVNASDFTVTRASFSTTAATAANGATITRYVNSGSLVLRFFADQDALTASPSGATATNTSTTYSSSNQYVFDLGSGTYGRYATLTLDLGRTYRFLTNDTSNTGYVLSFADISEGGNGNFGATEGVTTSGTPGSSGAYTQFVVTNSNISGVYSLFYYEDANSGFGGAVTVDPDPRYSEVYVYDPTGTWISTDVIVIGNTTQTVGTVTTGPYGYVQSYSSTSLKVSLGVGSAVFTTSNAFYDTPKLSGSARTLITPSAVTTNTDVDDTADYIFYDKAISGNVTDKNSGIVVGPGQNIVIYSTANTLSYVLDGFEDVTSDFAVVQYTQSL
jgi:hypothetical protein